MVSTQLLKVTGCTPERLREIFTCKDTDKPEHAIRKRIEDRARSRIQDGMTVCLQHANLWQAVDLAWDSTPIQKETIPLLLFAQGKIKMETFVNQLAKTGCADKYIKKDEKGVIKVDLPRLYEISINLIRSYVTRRLAAQTARFSNLWPYFKYEPFGTDDVAKLRGEVLSQRVDVMVNAYGYRHLFPQSYRHMFLYGRAVMFPRSAWDVKTGWRVKSTNVENEEPQIESFVEREGVDFTLAHPSRYYWDRSAPLPAINTDTGPNWIGYWDIVPFSAIKGGEYFNIDSVSTSDAQTGIISANGTYFQYYFDPKMLQFPECKTAAGGNDRRTSIGTYTANDCDKGVIVTQHFEKINPKAEGIGKLDAEVWVRLACAGDGTVVAAEFMPSTPAVYGGMNENDDRLVNTSMAMELMPFQDQLTNIFSQMLMNLRASMLQIWAIDKDAIADVVVDEKSGKTMMQHIQETLAGGQYYTEPQAWFYSGSKLNETGFSNPGANSKALLTLIQANVQTTINDSMNAVTACMNMADRILVLSPNEIGQPNPREVSAREVTELSSTTNSISSFISDGIDEQRAAVKKLLYESLVGMSNQNFRVPAMSRYLLKTVKKAGFSSPDNPSEDENAIVKVKSTIVGRISDLMYDYYFDSRDGGDRPVNSQGAAVLSQLMGQILQVPELAGAVGKKRIFEILNEIFRLSGAAYDLNLDIEDGETEDVPKDEPVAAGPAVDTELQRRVSEIEQFLMQLRDQLAGAGVVAPGQTPVDPAATPPALTAA